MRRTIARWTKMKTNKQLLAIAIKQLGNDGSKYREYVGASGNYCNMYVYWLFNANGCATLFPLPARKYYRTYCPDSIKWCRANLAQIPLYLAMACDIIYFDWELNGIPNHIGIVEEKVNTSTIKTIEGNTTGKKNGKTVSGIVARKNRSGKYVQGIFRPHFVPEGVKKKKLNIDGDFGYQSIFNLQLALGINATGILTKETVKALQKIAGATQDGAWGNGTSKAVQKMLKKAKKYTGKIDSKFGKNSVIALQKWINDKNYPPKKTKPVANSKTPNADKIAAKMKELAWAYGTPKDKYSYKEGAPKAACKKALKKYGWADDKAEMSDCGNNASAAVRESGVSKSFKALHGTKTPFPKKEEDFNIVLTGKKIPKGFLKTSDIIRYKKQNGNQHAMLYFGDGKVCESSHHNRFFAIVKDEQKYNNSKIAKISTVQVLRAKE